MTSLAGDASKSFGNLADGFGEPANIDPAKIHPAKIMAMLLDHSTPAAKLTKTQGQRTVRESATSRSA
jgi:hypothetical protein